MTIGLRSPTEQFLELARRADSLRLAQRLVQTSAAGDAHDRLSPLLHLIGSADSVRTLDAWAAADARLAPWTSLSANLWHADELMAQFPKVYDANVVAEDFHGEMSHRYLAAMAASRLPSGSTNLLTWLRTVKLWLLMRAVDAAEAGYIFEPSIRGACDEVRLGCEIDKSPRIPWLNAMVGDPSPPALIEFESHLLATANRLRTSCTLTEAGQRKLVTAFARVVEGKWRQDKLARAQPLWHGELACWPTRRTPDPATDGAPPTNDTDGDDQGEDDDDGDARGSAGVDPNSTPAEQSAKASGVLLVNQAEGHMLPWDWHSLILDERFALVDLVESMVQPTKPFVERLGGALMAIALLTSSSARRTPRIKAGRTSTIDWKVDVARGLLHRQAARRDKRWKAHQSASHAQISKWVRPLTNQWELRLTECIASALREAMPARGRNLRAAWNAVNPEETFEHWVNTTLAATPGLTRLTSPSLARAQRHCAYESLNDHALARLVSSSSQTVLPSACSYAAFTCTTVQGVLGPPFARLATWVTAADFANANGAGSEMDVDSARIKIALAALRKRITVAANDGDWARQHNLLTAYCVVGLLACTGARPVNSPFQSLAWFNFESGLVFVDDKSAGAQRGSRLCILAPAVIELIRDTYVPHLRSLARALDRSLPDFSEAIDEVLQGSPSARLPLFFFVKASSEFDWAEVSEFGLAHECGDDWPLPWNFCRHRLATQLRRMGLDTEIIDALLGHGEGGSESHGAQSLRVLADDLDSARAKIDALTLELDLRAPTPWSVPEIRFARAPTRPLLDNKRTFGSESRRLRRDAAHEHAVTQAVTDIKRALKGQPPESLSGDEWEAIGRQMLLRNDGMPQAFSSIRYAAYEKYLNQLWHEHGVRPRMRRRYTVPTPTRPVVSELALRAKELLANLRSAFDNVVVALGDAPPSAKLARALATIDICLQGRIADVSLLHALTQRAHAIPVRHQGQWYIEVFEGSRWSDGMPLRRFAVPARSIDWLLLGRDEKRSAAKPLPVPKRLEAFAALVPGAIAPTMPALLKQLSRVVDQFNVITLSGFEAAVLAGRIKISALPHGDWVRSTEGRALQRVAMPNPEATAMLDEAGIGDGWTGPGDPAGRTPDSCRALMKAISSVLTSVTERGGKAVTIETLLKRSPFINGDLPHALGRWIVYVLGRDAKTHADVLKLPTVERYFDALASKVSAIGHAAHLLDMDGDDLTDLYYELLQAPYFQSVHRQRNHKTKTLTKPLPDAKADTEPSGDAYAAARLVEFHEFARELFGLEDPDWSELGDFSDRPSGRPGLITTAEYLASVQNLVGPRADRNTALQLLECAWVLMLGFRFGLRGGEAVGLDRSDWIERAGAIVVLVRPNATRGLKTARGKRVVPLIEKLTDVEASVMEEIHRRFEERPADARSQALLSDLCAANFRYRRMQITGRLLRLVKQVTRNPGAIVHHARHSFANRIFALLAGRAFGLGSDGRFDATHCESTRRLLLGRLTLDRRALWALCRLLGHSSPATLIRSYLHVQVAPASRPGDHLGVVEHVRAGRIDIDAKARSVDYLKAFPAAVGHEPASLPAPSMVLLLNYLRLRHIGRPPLAAAYVVGIAPELAQRLEEALTASALRLEKVHAHDVPLQSGKDLIGSVRLARYRSLIDAAKGLAIDTTKHLESFEQFESTIGRSRQIVLFEAAHFAAMGAFIRDQGLTKNDIVLLRPKMLSEGFTQQIANHNLDRFAGGSAPANERTQQIDTAVVSLPDRLSSTVHPLRVAVKITGHQGQYASGYELLIGWVCYCLLRSRDPARHRSS